MLTVIVLLSGKHRLAWLEQAVMSIPIDQPLISAVHLIHQGGRWDWAPGLRERLSAMSKVRVIEYEDRVHYVDSFNRSTLGASSKWAMLLPDDDYLLTGSFADALSRSGDALASDCGFVGYGWYYLRANRFIADHVRQFDTANLQRFTPKFCTTLVNVERFRAVGGFSKAFGGFCDTVLYAQLAHAYNAWVSPTPVGVYRMHDAQASSNADSIYAPYLDATIDALLGLSGNSDAREHLVRRMNHFLSPAPGGRIGRSLDTLKLVLRGSAAPPLMKPRRPVQLLLAR